MKIGIATLFAPSNYGNALQMLSLQRYLSEHGHEAEILRHWLSPKCAELRYYHNRIATIRGLVRFVFDVLSFGGAWSNFVREHRMTKWVYRNYRMSDLAGADGEFPVAQLKYDCVVAGSDQIWNPKYKWPEFNLLKDIPDKILRVAYAGSFGTDDRSLFDVERFVPALLKFKAISVREASAKKIINEMFALPADLVCDPTLLHTRDEWCKLLGIKKVLQEEESYVVYMVTPDFRRQWKTLIRLAKETRKRVHFFAFSSYAATSVDARHPIKTIVKTLGNLCRPLYLRLCGVRLHMTATPDEFVYQLSRAKGVFTDSFHGLMFATIFGKPCNVSIGMNPDRLLMSARLKDFITEFSNSQMLSKGFDVGSLRMAEITPKLQLLIDDSKLWLNGVLAGEHHKVP